ncbi:flagellar hook-basal body protein FliE [Thermosipho melanesiensis]|uniref:Flagellar hook-basal body complex protein FliE n=2 Tax=Thermosipho melanesiensis TaxID=46541 RepID=A6LM30_THEM4|nr:flagellar hook-basal body complex protein FliE [Thermosipho melanesiensis]ABR30981.1 flagellar hook-basal body complex subunit FliE [Thermosipho melanesiensis BI429]APT74078.1 flagellar hook-basal body protein FliE [Thermosipho melanesiensis]OOC36024.1 flagellar hook-basal body protein FliE [Thermosipho melanesiensis]OOC36841.1 flagellar hook-basal body protein FliE [Thermosipho melanesiensis]OOC37592.1 flagellar hook-basal body protein FliE [Thermosipho melanesiensis]
MVDKINGVGNYGNLKPNTLKKSNADFSKILNDAIKEVNQQQKKAEQMANDFATGKISNIHEVIVEAEKASISLRLTVEVRNKIVDAYKEIMRMQF